ncbi:Sulfate/thiosulfate import ATP-binding protein CysA [bacterium HR17]|uniref:Sulfate/thiosulfate import ATP-binding protein CysA n=1 Tax=Candidatus Fervidibacter japonicus TaxID=2035412 RepID=A0A2H5XDV8_9BACT|nr:Sulfate/thiosulfate import ATP-binding protein CysA [bacterium HR17]
MLRVEHLSIRLGEFDLRDISLEVRAGEYFVLLGPTGTGKTVLIECIAGLHRPRSGRIVLNGCDVTDLPPEERGIAYVPQDYALFPNLTVFENIAFGLRVRKLSDVKVRARVHELAEWLRITYLLDRLPLTLSGGEKQRVALARALAVDPQILLLDEPLAAVDEQTRERLCRELKTIQRQTEATFIHVSHNFEETLAVADRIGVMNFTEEDAGRGMRLRVGRLLQVGTPEEIFYRPANEFVAQFTRAENIWRGVVRGQTAGWVQVWLNGAVLWAQVPEGRQVPKGEVTVVVRPERVRLMPAQTQLSEQMNSLHGEVVALTDKGAMWRVEVATEASVTVVALLSKREAEQSGVTLGQSVAVALEPSFIHLCPTTVTGTIAEPIGVEK